MSSLIITRTSIPSSRNYALIVCYLLLLNDNPMAQGTTRSLVPAYTLSSCRPGVLLPLRRISNSSIAILDIGNELLEEVLSHFSSQLTVKTTNCSTAYHSRHPYLRCKIQNLGNSIDLVNHELLCPGNIWQ